LHHLLYSCALLLLKLAFTWHGRSQLHGRGRDINPLLLFSCDLITVCCLPYKFVEES
jgi:hypothetical protein